MTDKTGGPAFPDPSRAVGSAPMGMTLRDYFAGQALAGMADELSYRNYSDIAQRAYHLGDAMIEAREVSDA